MVPADPMEDLLDDTGLFENHLVTPLTAPFLNSHITTAKGAWCFAVSAF
jgi:hypothetical protein